VKTKLIESEFTADLIPNPLEYAVLLPDNYDDAMKNYPLLSKAIPYSPWANREPDEMRVWIREC
jgi:DUF1680 family protein